MNTINENIPSLLARIVAPNTTKAQSSFLIVLNALVAHIPRLLLMFTLVPPLQFLLLKFGVEPAEMTSRDRFIFGVFNGCKIPAKIVINDGIMDNEVLDRCDGGSMRYSVVKYKFFCFLNF